MKKIFVGGEEEGRLCCCYCYRYSNFEDFMELGLKEKLGSLKEKKGKKEEGHSLEEKEG